MQLSDFHIHSNCSTDASDTMLDMSLACGELGIETICFTDHCDIDAYTTGVLDPDCFAVWPDIQAQYAFAVGRLPSRLDVRLGLELGEANHSPGMAAKIYSQPELDFVLGSIHNLRDTPDFYALPYESEEHCIALLHRYLDELYELAAMDCFDSMSHIGYTKRYMLRAGYTAAVEDARYAEQADVLLRRLIQRGKAMEINCSGLRHPGVTAPIPGVSILRRYLELGGELITVGSDAHKTADAGRGIAAGLEILRDIGYRYYCNYKNHKPEFISLD